LQTLVARKGQEKGKVFWAPETVRIVVPVLLVLSRPKVLKTLMVESGLTFSLVLASESRDVSQTRATLILTLWQDTASINLMKDARDMRNKSAGRLG
jgi:hypothetical protein